jgi:hypothetical protein
MYLHEQIQNEYIWNALAVDKMISDFIDPEGTDFSIFSVMSASLVLASAATGFIPVAGQYITAALTVGIGSFSMASIFEPDSVDPTAKLSDQLSGAFGGTMKQLGNTMDAAFNGGDTSILPVLDENSHFQTNTSKFFADGRWLVPSVEDSMKPVIDEMAKRTRHGVINTLVKASSQFIMIDQNAQDEESCLSYYRDYSDNTVSGAMAVWLEGLTDLEAGCAILFSWQSFPSGAGFPMDNSYTDMMTNDYEIDLNEMYSNAWECAIKHPEGDGKLSFDPFNFEVSDKLPECFWNVGVIRGWWHDGDFNSVEVGDLDTTS